MLDSIWCLKNVNNIPFSLVIQDKLNFLTKIEKTFQVYFEYKKSIKNMGIDTDIFISYKIINMYFIFSKK